jgi:hypothetical protein
MKKYTKRFKNNKYNRTFKKGGAINTPNISVPDSDNNINTNVNDDNDNNDIRNVGIFGYLGDKVKSGVGKITSIAEDSALGAFGLEKINHNEDNNNQEENDNQNNNSENDSKSLLNTATGLVSNISDNIKNVANKTGASVIENVNEVLGSDVVKENIQQAANNTVSILKDNAEIVNNALNNPEVKEEIIEAINNGAEIGNVAIEAAREPINKGAEVIAEAVPNAMASASSGAVKVVTDFMGAIPGVGAVLDMLKAANDGSKAVAGVVEATSDVIEAGSDLIAQTKENFEKGMEILERNKKLAEKISNRTNKTINDFENPLNKFKNSTVQAAGSRKTKRRLLNRKAKSKRVRFSI